MIGYPSADSIPSLLMRKLIPCHIDDFDTGVLEGVSAPIVAIHLMFARMAKHATRLYINALAVLCRKEQISIGAAPAACHLFLNLVEGNPLVELSFPSPFSSRFDR